MLSIDEIKLLGRQSIHRTAGVYFLIHRDTITYVGQSSDIFGRIGQHLRDKTKEFDTYAFVACKGRKARLQLEAEYIAYIKHCKQPIKNRT